MFADNLGLALLILVALAAMLYRTRNWGEIHPQERRGILVAIGACIIAFAVAILDPPWAGRWIMGILIAGFVGFQILYLMSRRMHAVTLDEFAGETGMTAIRNSEEERTNPEIRNLRKWMESDVYRWKARGYYPALVAEKGDWTLIVRVPHTVDFDFHALDHTMFAFIRKLNVNTILAGGWPLKEEDRPKKTLPTNDAEFDERFYLTGALQATDDALAVFNEKVREHMMSLTDLPGWIRVERFGIYYYMPGAVTSKAEIDQVISLLEVIGEAVSEAGKC